MTYLSNAFSISMLTEPESTLRFRKVTVEEARSLLDSKSWSSCVGHGDMAQIVSGLLGLEVPANRVSVSLNQGDMLIAAQYIGPRLPEGTTKLPPGANIVFYVVEVV